MRDSATYLDDQLEELEPPYESPAQRQIGRTLDQYGIPFFYRQPALVYDDGSHRIWHPDFTLPGYNGLVVEYAGAGDPRQLAHVQRKRDVYALNQIPAVFVYPGDMLTPGWQERLAERAAEAGVLPYGGDPASYSTMRARPTKVYQEHPHVGGGYR